jgi:hypothetical protein
VEVSEVQKKYQIFVPSTFRDLADERQDAIRNILDLGHIPAGMELFPASDTEQLSYIKKVIDECDYYLLIMGGRYGSLDSNGISFTEREYDYAVEAGKVVLAFVHGDTSIIPIGKSDTAPRLQANLEAFKDKVMRGRLVREWITREGLEPLVLKAIIRAISDYPAAGWVRGDAAATTETLQKMNDLLIENERLKAALATLKAANKPLLEGLAGLEDTYVINYTYSHSYGGRHGGSSTRDGSKTLTWSEIFTAVGPDLRAPTTSYSLAVALAKHLQDKHGTGSGTSVKKADREIVEGHLVALGLLKSYNANSVKGGLHAYIELTDLGRRKLVESLAIRKLVAN